MRKIGLKNIPVGKIRPNPFQPRASYDEKELIHLCESIRAHGGIIHPIVVRWRDNSYEIASGYRRWLAAKRLSDRTIPAIVCELTDQEMLQTALVENLQREDLAVLEEARGLAKLKERSNMTYREVGEMVGKTGDYVAQRIRLLSLPDRILEILSRDKISSSLAEAIAAKSPETQTMILALIEQGHELTVGQVSQFNDIGTAQKKRQLETKNAPDNQPLSPEAYAASTVKPCVRLTRGVWACYKSRYANAQETIAQFVHRIVLTYFAEKGHPLQYTQAG